MLAPRVAQVGGPPAAAVAFVLGTVLVAGAVGNMIGWAAGSRLRRRTHQTPLRASTASAARCLRRCPRARDLVPGAEPRGGPLPRPGSGGCATRRSCARSTPPCHRHPSLIGEAAAAVAARVPRRLRRSPREPSATPSIRRRAPRRGGDQAAQDSTVEVSRRRLQPRLLEPGQRLRRRRRARAHERPRRRGHRAAMGARSTGGRTAAPPLSPSTPILDVAVLRACRHLGARAAPAVGR